MLISSDTFGRGSATIVVQADQILCRTRKLSVDQFDVTCAFTQAEIDAEIYVEPPKGFATTGKDGRPQVLRLKKALYGTKQAARLWQQALVKRLKTMGFTQSAHDPCLFRYVGEHGECLVAAYVDDLLCATSNQAAAYVDDLRCATSNQATFQ